MIALLCRLRLHRWRYHSDANGLPERRICLTCLKHQWIVGGAWR